MARHRPCSTLKRFQILQVDQGSSVLLARCSFGMTPLSHFTLNLMLKRYFAFSSVPAKSAKLPVSCNASKDNSNTCAAMTNYINTWLGRLIYLDNYQTQLMQTCCGTLCRQLRKTKRTIAFALRSISPTYFCRKQLNSKGYDYAFYSP